MPNRHSGLVIVACADWAYHRHHERIFDTKRDPLMAHFWALVEEIMADEDPDAIELDLRAWARQAHELHELSTAASTSRLVELVEFAATHPDNAGEVLPHILRVEAPALVVGDRSRRSAFIELSPTVLSGAHTVLIDGHSNCAGIAASRRELYVDDQFELQRDLMTTGSQPFANLLAINAGHEVTVISTYTQFGLPGEVLETRDICTVKSTVPVD